MSSVARRLHAISDRQKSMFQHVDHWGQVRALHLTRETQRFFAASDPEGPEGANPGIHAQGCKTCAAPESSPLTAREMQVFDLLILGLSNKLIAHELSISPRTVEVHRARLMRKMGVRNTAALIRLALAAA